MSTDPNSPIDTRTRWQKIRPWLWRAGYALLPVLSALLVQQGCPKEVVVEVEKIVPAPPVESPPPEEPAMGWHLDPESIKENLDPDKTLHFDRTPAAKAVQGDSDVFLWRAVRKAGHFGDNAYPNVNQKSVGCCVGCGWKHSADVCQATAILNGAPFEWKPVSVEVIYAGSRVDVGGGRMRGDGSVGAWAEKWCQSAGGIAAMQKYQSVDLSTFSPARARQWGSRGIPSDVKTAAREHPVKGCALVKSWADVKKAIQQGYPVAVCSDQGFRMTRDSTGRCRPQGVWPHCMAIIGVRTAGDGHTEGGFILNSWGDNAHTGPVWPPDMPVAGFWADASVIDRMVRQGDSFALADVAGFPARKLDWTVHARPQRLRPVPKRNAPDDLFAHNFKLEVPLSW